ncbi:hypothetical protein MTO96_026975, partial [Rhipicephalus appendiculatus]
MSLLSLCWSIIDYDLASWRRQCRSDQGCCSCIWLMLHELGRISVVVTRVLAVTLMVIANDGMAGLLFFSNGGLTWAFVTVMGKVGAIHRDSKEIYVFPFGNCADVLHTVAATAAVTYSFVDAADSSFRALLCTVYVHSWYQIWESVAEFSKEGMKHGVDFYPYFRYALPSCFFI